MSIKSKELLHKVVHEIIEKDHTPIIQKAIASCITPATTVTVTVGRDDSNTESIIVVFENSVLRYTGSVDFNTYIDTCIEYDIPTAIRSVVCNTLKGFSDCMFDIFFKPMSEQDKILKNIK